MAEQQFSPAGVDELLATVREKIIRLHGTGENWQIVLNGTRGKVRLECREFQDVALPAETERRRAEGSPPVS